MKHTVICLVPNPPNHFLKHVCTREDHGHQLCQYLVELEMKAIRRFAKVSIVSYSRPSLMIIA